VSREDSVVGIDLGGTNMRVGLVSAEGKVLHKEQTPTRAETASGAEILDSLAELVMSVRRNAPEGPAMPRALGLGIPGPLDPTIGGVKDSPNLGQLDNLPIVEILGEKTGLDVVLENDANAAAWGEFWVGAGQNCESMVMATLGTGIGGGIILNGKLIRGIDHTAGELGHVRVVDGGRPCACGSHGCIEAYASANSTVRRFLEAVAAGGGSRLAELPREEITCQRIFGAAVEGDALARDIVNETGRLLGLLAADMANLLNPERMVFSGGMTNAGELLFDAIRNELKTRAFPVPGARLQVLPAELGADAGLIGAAGCALNTSATSRS
jgi:glucokinase